MLGAFVGGIHLLWSVIVAVGLAQPLVDFILSVHFLNNPFTVAQFDLWFAFLLVAITSIVGFVVGWFLAFLWNRFQTK